jgi:hypothetical protein
MGFRGLCLLAFVLSLPAMSANRYYRCEALWRGSYLNLTVHEEPVGDYVALYRAGHHCYLFKEAEKRQGRLRSVFVPIDTDGRVQCSSMFGVKDSSEDHFMRASVDEVLVSGEKGARGRVSVEIHQGTLLVRARYYCEEAID